MSGRGLLPSSDYDKLAPQKDKDEDDEDPHSGDDRLGQWIRRRCLDGALNRAPEDFYPKFWKVLEKVRSLASLNHKSQNIVYCNWFPSINNSAFSNIPTEIVGSSL